MHLRHRSAVTAHEPHWHFDHEMGDLMVALTHAVFAVSLCSTNRPRFGAHPVLRIDETSWRVPAARYRHQSPQGQWLTEMWPLHELLGTDGLTLIDAPAHVCSELANLVDADVETAR